VSSWVEPVEPKVFFRVHGSSRRRVDADDPRCPCFGGMKREATRVREQVEHAFSGSPTPEFATVVTMIEEQARLLTFVEIGEERNAVFGDRYLTRRSFAPKHADPIFLVGVALTIHDARQRRGGAQRARDAWQLRFEHRRVTSDHDVAAVVVYDDAGQTVAFAVDPTKRRRALRSHRLAMLPRAGELSAVPSFVGDLLPGVQAQRELRVGVE